MAIVGETTHYQLTKCAYGHERWEDEMNLNLDKLDTEIKNSRNPSNIAGVYEATIKDDIEKMKSDFDITISTVTGIPELWFTDVVPDGYLECDGSSLLRTEYTALYSVLGVRHGFVDENHFNLPDCRGILFRGYDHGAGNDPDAASRTAANPGGVTGDEVGSYQSDAIRNITGYFENTIHTTPSEQLLKYHNGVFYYNTPKYLPGIYHSNYGTLNARTNFDASRQVPTAGDNRPKNISVMIIIKY